MPSAALRLPRLLVAALLLATAACAEPGPYEDHDEPSDFDPVPDPDSGKADVAGIPAVFDRHLVMSDALFTDVDTVDAAEVQAFFERTPYGNRSWLADATIDGVPASEAIVAASRAAGINPVVMISRMQVEKSLVSKTVRPAQSRIDYAFGCGCPDGRACNTAYQGLDKQVECAATTLRRWYDGSVAGDGLWVMGRAKRTLDPLTVTPRSHATSSLYAYTPWVLTGSGGNWLAWNVARRYLRHLDAQGALTEP
ncbi:MAG: hypothetical protein F9K40_04875 [Kofleriaceae bacterium]|nr:MAG: hypothetical protein F9K40_04875 [Kofleriaceae bacterium]MBZ0235784.1 hypothetical protein [Kofleriaceae bacterium]